MNLHSKISLHQSTTVQHNTHVSFFSLKITNFVGTEQLSWIAVCLIWVFGGERAKSVNFPTEFVCSDIWIESFISIRFHHSWITFTFRFGFRFSSLFWCVGSRHSFERKEGCARANSQVLSVYSYDPPRALQFSHCLDIIITSLFFAHPSLAITSLICWTVTTIPRSLFCSILFPCLASLFLLLCCVLCCARYCLDVFLSSFYLKRYLSFSSSLSSPVLLFCVAQLRSPFWTIWYLPSVA